MRADGPRPNILLDNLLVENSASVVLVSGAETILPGNPDTYLTPFGIKMCLDGILQLLDQVIFGTGFGKKKNTGSTSGPITIQYWAMRRRYTSFNGTGSYVTGLLDPAPAKSTTILDGSGKFFERSKPQYESNTANSFIIATKHGVDGRGTRCQTGAINRLLQSAAGAPFFFPAGVYLVEGTIHIPVGSIIVGEGWSQIMGAGSLQMKKILKSWSSRLSHGNHPATNLGFRVGKKGGAGSVEISDMLLTVKGATVGAILMEWNIHESTQGSGNTPVQILAILPRKLLFLPDNIAGMWDSHFRVGGAVGSDLQLSDCPKLTDFVNLKAASMLLHLTSKSCGYFEKVSTYTFPTSLRA